MYKFSMRVTLAIPVDSLKLPPNAFTSPTLALALFRSLPQPL
jgi:hypothetical protein